MFKYNSSYLINTPSGYLPFRGIQVVKKLGQITLQLENGSNLKCSPNHRLMVNGNWEAASKIRTGDSITCKNSISKVFHAEYTQGEFEYYDVVGVDTSQFYANDILSHNCEFLGSSSTLISGTKLKQLTYQNPIKHDSYLKIYAEPEEGKLYTVVVDTARGKEGDYSAFKIFDHTEFPYKDVATYRNNLIDPVVYPNIIHQLAKLYNNAYILVETNDVGQQVADILQHDLEYENMLFTVNKGIEGIKISSGYGGAAHAGVRTTKPVKKIGCSNFKSLIENDKLIISDHDTLQEMFRFVAKGTSYEAEEGNDDCVMCCVLFSWLTDQSFFKELSNTDFRKNLFIDNEKRLEEELTPFGVVYDHNEKNEVEMVEIRDLEHQSFEEWMRN